MPRRRRHRRSTAMTRRPRIARMLNVLLVIVATLVLVVVATRWYGSSRWAARTQALRSELVAARVPTTARAVDFAVLKGLPAPVQRFFRAVLTDGHPFITAVHLRRHGRAPWAGPWSPRHGRVTSGLAWPHHRDRDPIRAVIEREPATEISRQPARLQSYALRPAREAPQGAWPIRALRAALRLALHGSDHP
jgi:hypothetical protein